MVLELETQGFPEYQLQIMKPRIDMMGNHM